MNRVCLMAVLACTSPSIANAQAVTTPTEAFRAGQTFSNSTRGNQAAGAAINATVGSSNVPRYNTNPPQAGVYGNGQSLIGGAGATRQAECRTSVSGNAYEQQECDAVNYLTRNPTDRPRFRIDARTDPLIVNSARTITNPGTVPDGGVSACHIERTVVPGTYTQENCTEVQTLENQSCSRVLNVQVTTAGNCTEGGPLASAGFGWRYDYRRGADLYIDGGMARAFCYPAQTDQITFGFFAGNVAEGQFGAGAEFRPGPNPALLPVQEVADLPTTVTVDTVMPATAITALAGSGCGAEDRCNYRFSHGPATYACEVAGELVRYRHCIADPENGEMCTDQLAPSIAVTASSACYGSPASAPLVEGQLVCDAGRLLYGTSCYAPTGNVSRIVGGATGGYIFSLNFIRPRIVTSVTESWDTSQCAPFESRASR